MNKKSNSTSRVQELSDEGLRKWLETLKEVGASASSFHHGSDAERVMSEWQPTLEEVVEELESRGLSTS